MKTVLQLAGSRINFDRRNPPAGFTTPCYTALWNGSGSFFLIGNNSRLPEHEHVSDALSMA